MAKSQYGQSAFAKMISTHPMFGGDDKQVSDEYLPWDADYGGYHASEYFDEENERDNDIEYPVLMVPGNTGTKEHANSLARHIGTDMVYIWEPDRTTPSIDDVVEQVGHFVPRMLDDADADKFYGFAQSYGAPSLWKAVHENDLYEEFEKFAALGGALKGTQTADIGKLIGLRHASPDFITRRSAEYGELAELWEESDLTDHTRILTVRSNRDACFDYMSKNYPGLRFTPAVFHPRYYEENLESPAMEGATNLVLEDLKDKPIEAGPMERHKMLRYDPDVLDAVEHFFEE